MKKEILKLRRMEPTETEMEKVWLVPLSDCFCQFFGLRVPDPITLSVVYNCVFLRNLVRQQCTDVMSFCMQFEKETWVNAGGFSE